jgi:hypothetical protein
VPQTQQAPAPLPHHLLQAISSSSRLAKVRTSRASSRMLLQVLPRQMMQLGVQ